MKEILGRERQDRRREVSIWQSWMSLVAVELALTAAAVSVRRSMADQNILPCGIYSRRFAANNGAYAAFILRPVRITHAQTLARFPEGLQQWGTYRHAKRKE